MTSNIKSFKNLKSLLDEITQDAKNTSEKGKVADYIEQLANIDPNNFAISISTKSGDYNAGNYSQTFSIQSISKVFTLSLALGLIGDRLWNKVGREPSGNAFNSILQLEHEQGRPRNPFINAGAIAVADIILSNYQPKEAIGSILQFVRSLAQDNSIMIDQNVAKSELATGFKNAALANYLRSYSVVKNPIENILGVYFHHCAIAMSCDQLAKAGKYLAFHGAQSPNGTQIISSDRARRIAAIMTTCGLYDGSGNFAYRVGLPAKSGVGGGILAIVPNIASIAVWSPGLDKTGNSLIGINALEKLSKTMNWSIFG